MTPREKRIFVAIAVAIALTRLLAVAHSLFDADEALFSLGVRDYDVTRHQPHPPGYPLFVLAGKALHALGASEFRALQIVTVLGSMFVFPALFWLARELGFGFATAVAGAAIYAFLPNVWLYGGTAFSDVPATTLAFAACALLLRGRSDARAYVLGAAVLGVAAGMRTSNLLIGAVPALLATWSRARSSVRPMPLIALAITTGALVVGASYFGAALASESVTGYRDAVEGQREWVRDVDSWRNPGRGPLSEAAVAFFVRPFQHQDLLNAMAIVAAISFAAALVRRRSAPLLTVATFAPLAIASWLNFDINTVSRYAIGYMAVHALLAADGFRVLFRKEALQAAFCIILIGVCAYSAWPALREQRTSDAPAVAALRYAGANAAPGTPVYVHASLTAHAEYLLPRHRKAYFDELHDIPADAEAWFVDWRVQPEARNFVRGRRATWKVLRRRNFEASAGPVRPFARFAAGWYAAEGSEGRWMRGEGVVMLPPLEGEGRLSLRLSVPVDSLPAPPSIEVRMNGNVIDRFPGTEKFMNRTWVVPSRDGENELRLRTSATFVPARRGLSRDTRELGLRVLELTWTPAR